MVIDLRSRKALLLTLLASLAMAVFARSNAASAQECRRMCLVGEVRDANGCCAPAATPPPEIRCPAGTSWNPTQRACVGRRVCPAGSHPVGGLCVADAVACPPGTRREDGACVSEITCPPQARLEGNRCVTDVTCPTGTTLTNGTCVSQDVTCPAGTTRQEGIGCVAPPACPPNAQFVAGRGCVGAVTCPMMTHLEADACVPDHVCLDGQQWSEGQCRSVCSAIEHSRWDGERRSCVCEQGFRADGNGCVQHAESAQCPDGSHRENNQCVSDVICPDGFRFEQGRGCIDRVAEDRARQQQEEHAREERFRRNELAREEREAAERRWGRGPGVQLSGGGGYMFFMIPNAYRAYTIAADPNTTLTSFDAAAAWNGPTATGALTFISGDLSLTGSYTFSPSSSWVTGNTPTVCPTTGPLNRMVGERTFCVQLPAMHLAMLDLGQQGVGPRHAWRVGVGLGWEFSGSALAAQLSYRSTFRIAAGFFVAVDIRLLGMIRFVTEEFTSHLARRLNELTGVPNGWSASESLPELNASMMPTGNTNKTDFGAPGVGGGVNGTVLLGYSFQ